MEDGEQDWWTRGPLASRAAEEQECWRAEQEEQEQQNLSLPAATVAPLRSEPLTTNAVDAEPQWLQPLTALWEQLPC